MIHEAIKPAHPLAARLTRGYRQILCWLLGIERWHAGAEERHPYRQEILRRLRAHAPVALLEVGAGLGDIVCRVKARQCVSGDISGRVLCAARLCHPWQWITRAVRFRKMRLGEPVTGCFDAVVCVNFIHAIAPVELRAHFRSLVKNNLMAQGMLVFDVVSNPTYRYNHDPDFLLHGLGMQWETVAGFEFGRSLIFAHKTGGV